MEQDLAYLQHLMNDQILFILSNWNIKIQAPASNNNVTGVHTLCHSSSVKLPRRFSIASNSGVFPLISSILRSGFWLRIVLKISNEESCCVARKCTAVFRPCSLNGG
jgi:hypothetical protein